MARKPNRRGTNEIDQHVALRLKAARLAAGLSQEDAGDCLGVSFQQIQKYERGTNRITAGKMAMLADYYNVSIEWFFPEAPDGPMRRDVGAEMIATPHGSEVAEHFVAIKNRDDLILVARFAKALARAA